MGRNRKNYEDEWNDDELDDESEGYDQEAMLRTMFTDEDEYDNAVNGDGCDYGD